MPSSSLLTTFRHDFIPIYESYMVLNQLHKRHTMGEYMLDSWVQKYGLLRQYFEPHVTTHGMLDALEKCAKETSEDVQKW